MLITSCCVPSSGVSPEAHPHIYYFLPDPSTRVPQTHPSTHSKRDSSPFSKPLQPSSLYCKWLGCLPSDQTRTWGPSLPSFSPSPPTSNGASHCRLSFLGIFRAFSPHWHHLRTDSPHFSPKRWSPHSSLYSSFHSVFRWAESWL